MTANNSIYYYFITPSNSNSHFVLLIGDNNVIYRREFILSTLTQLLSTTSCAPTQSIPTLSPNCT